MQNNVDRVKQFLPFDALNGFREALINVNIKKEDRLDLNDELSENLNFKIHYLNKGVIVKIKHYYEFEYIETSGIIKKIDNIYKCIYLLDTKIYFDDIIDIEIV